MAAAATRKMHACGPGYLGNLLWSFGLFGHRDEVLLAAAADVVLAKWDAIVKDDESLAKAIWAFQQLNYTDKRLADTLAELGVNLAGGGGGGGDGSTSSLSSDTAGAAGAAAPPATVEPAVGGGQ